MTKWIDLFSKIAFGFFLFFLFLAVIFEVSSFYSVEVSEPSPQLFSPPKNSFIQPEESYTTLKQNFLALKTKPFTLSLPDIKKNLSFCGQNRRKDANALLSPYYFCLTGVPEKATALKDTPLYITYDPKNSQIPYSFSKNNQPTNLWITAKSDKDPQTVQVSLRMKDEKGQIIDEPLERALFSLTEKENRTPFYPNADWEMGKYKVDGSLLARLKAKWHGKDKFLQKYGGKEFEELSQKERIDFDYDGEKYSSYLGKNSVLVFKGNKFKEETPSDATKPFPILELKKGDERLLQLELWDVEGKKKALYTLLKSQENWSPSTLAKSFKLIGSRTRSQFIFDINKERVLLSPEDWIVKTDKGWKKLVLPQDIDDYVDRKIVGPLFVFDSLEKNDGKEIIKGTLFSPMRSDSFPLEIMVQSPSASLEEMEPKSPLKSKETLPVPKNKMKEPSYIPPHEITEEMLFNEEDEDNEEDDDEMEEDEEEEDDDV